MKNIGTRSAEKPEYDRSKARITDFEQSGIAAAYRQGTEALEWIESRGNAGDNPPKEALGRLMRALDGFESNIGYVDTHTALECAFDILETQMHPTCRDIVGSPAKQVIYTITGRRAYEFKK